MKANLKSLILKYIYSHEDGWLHALLMFKCAFDEWIFGNRVHLLSKRTKKQKSVVATAFWGNQFGDNPRFIVEKLHELAPDTDIVWVRSKGSDNCFPPYVRTIDFENKKALIRELARASIIIDNNKCFNNIVIQPDQLHIQTWHGGLGFKKIGFEAVTNKYKRVGCSDDSYDFFISNSDHITKTYRTAFKYQGPVWKCGYPVDDALLTDENERRLCHEQYNIPDDTHILLYGPTFRTPYKWLCQFRVDRVLEAFQKRFGGKWVMLVHWHPYVAQEDRVLPGAIDATDTKDMQRLIKAADAFISDYSSCIFQSACRNIPCFVYADDYEDYRQKRGLYYSLDEQPFPYALSEEKLVDNIISYDRAEWEKIWKRYAEQMGFVMTGHSAEDIARVCADFLDGKPKGKIMAELPFDEKEV